MNIFCLITYHIPDMIKQHTNTMYVIDVEIRYRCGLIISTSIIVFYTLKPQSLSALVSVHCFPPRVCTPVIQWRGQGGCFGC